MSEPVQFRQIEGKQRISGWLLGVMAVACGISVANLYYGQPLLADIGRTFHVTSAQLGMVAMLTQVGYALGLLFFVPLGDILERRRLIMVLSFAVTLALIFVASAHSILWLAVANLLVGSTTVVPQVIVPLAADMADAAERGKVVGTVMSGLLFGILLARTVSGFVGGWFGWRTMYLAAAVMMLALTVVLRLFLSKSRPVTSLSYRRLMSSLWSLARNQPVLWEASVMGAALFGSFSVFWTTLVFFLEQPPYHYGSEVVGLFGLVGVVGASAAPLAGRLADIKGPRLIAGIGAGITFLAYGVFGLLGHQFWGLLIGIILLDAGVQGTQIANQATIYSLVPEASNRLNTVYMVSYFIGGALGSAVGAYSWSLAKWNGVSASGLCFSGLAVLTWLVSRYRQQSLIRGN